MPLWSIAAIGAVSVAFAPQARAQFEGTITMHMTSQRGGQDIQWSVKNERARMDMGGAGGAMYMIRQGDKATIVMPTQKMYMEQNIPNAMGEAGKDGKFKPGSIEFTGKKEMIAGYECEHVITTSDDGKKYDVCLAKGLGAFMIPNNPMGRGRGGDSGPMAEIMKKLDGAVFPLKVQQVGGTGVELEVTKIEKKSLDESLFSVPSDYKNLSGMFGRPPGE